MRGFGTVQFKKIGKQLVAFFLVLALLGGSGVMTGISRFGFSKVNKAAAQGEISKSFSVTYTGFLYVPPLVYDAWYSFCQSTDLKCKSSHVYAIDHVEVYGYIENGGSGSYIDNPFINNEKQQGGNLYIYLGSVDPYSDVSFRDTSLSQYPSFYFHIEVPCDQTTRWGIVLNIVYAPGGFAGPPDDWISCGPFFHPYSWGTEKCPGGDPNDPSSLASIEYGLWASYPDIKQIEGDRFSVGSSSTGFACYSPPPPSPFDLTFLGDLFANAFSLQSSPDKIYAPNIVATSGAAPSFEPVVFGTVRSAVRIGNYTPNIDTQGQINAILTRLGKYKITKNSVSEAINYLNSNTTTQPPEGWIISVSGSGVETLTGVTITSGAKGTIILPSGKTLNITGNISYADDTASLAIVALDNSDPAIKVASSVTSLRGAYITLGGIQLPDKPIGVEGLLVGKDIKLPYPGNSSTFTYDHNLTENPPPGLREILNAIFKESAP